MSDTEPKENSAEVPAKEEDRSAPTAPEETSESTTSDVVPNEESVAEEPSSKPTLAEAVFKDLSGFEMTGYWEPSEDEDKKLAVPVALGGRSTIPDIIEQHYPNWSGEKANDQHLTAMLMLTKSIVKHIAPVNRNLSKLSKIITDDEGNQTGIQRNKPEIKAGKVISEDTAFAIMSACGKSGKYHAPLVNSGFRIEFKRSTAESRIYLDELLAENMGEIGRHTMGGSYLNTHVYMTREITQFLKEHMTDHNIEGIGSTNADRVFEYIAAADYPTLINMIAVCEYPHGYDITVPCGNCGAMTEGKITPAHIMKVDGSMLTSAQREQICRSMQDTVTEEEIENYQSLFPKPKPFVLNFDNDIKWTFEMARPRLIDRINVGVSWCDGINRAIQRHMEKRDSRQVRERITQSLLAINTLSNYLPYIKCIKVRNTTGELDQVVDDLGVIHKLLKEILDHPDVNKLIEALENHNTNDNPVIHGVTPHECGKCGHISKESLVEVDLETQLFTQALPGSGLSDYCVADR